MSKVPCCPAGHEYTEKSVFFARQMCRGKIRTQRKCKACAVVYRFRPTERAVRKIFTGLSAGFTITHLTTSKDRPADCDVKVRWEKWRGIKEQMPKVAARIIKLSDANALVRKEERRRLYRVEAPAIVHRRILDIWQTVQSLVPVHWPDDKRKETIARVGLELSDGRCAPTEAAIRAAVARAGTDHNRMFSEWALGGGAGKWVSLDAPRYEDGATTVGDTVSEGLWT